MRPVGKTLGVVVAISFAVLVSATFSTRVVSGQAKGGTAKWTMLSGKENDFFFAIPETCVIHTNKDLALDENGYSRVDLLKTLVCRANDTVLQVSLYEGATREIEKRLLERFNKSGSNLNDFAEEQKPENRVDVSFTQKTADVIGFPMNEFLFVYKGHEEKIQVYRSRERVYLLKAVARDRNDQLVKDFFESVKLVNGDKVASPNLNGKVEPATSAKMLLPKAVTLISFPLDGVSQPVELKDTDQPPVLAYLPRPGRSSPDTRFDRGFYLLKLKVLLLANGKVGSVEPITKISKEIEKESIAAAKEIVFLPARKKGKPVSTYLTVRYSLAFVY